MKRIRNLIVILILIFVLNIKVFAASSNLTVSSNQVNVGDTFTVTVDINGAAAWNVHLTATGPVSGCSINQADATGDALDTNKTFNTTCTATGTGTITIRLNGDITSASDGNAVNISGTKTVSVSRKQYTPNNNKNNTNTNNTNNITDNKSNNNNIKELTVEGYNLTKIDNNNYSLVVPNDVTSINIKAIAEDSKANVGGTGVHNLNVGENNFEVIVTSESGLQNKINLKVIRKDGYFLEDLDSILKNDKNNNNITIDSNTKVSASDLEKIKDSKKTINFNYYDENKSLIYSWIINGSKIKSTDDFITTVCFDSKNKKDMLKLSNYADGLFISFGQTNYFPSGTKIRLYVGSKYTDKDIVNVYSYIKNSNKLNLVKSKLKVKNGYIEFDVVDASDYLITMSTISNSTPVTTPNNNTSSNILPIFIIIIILILIIVIMIIYILKNRKENKNKEIITNDNISSIINNNNYNNQNNGNVLVKPIDEDYPDTNSNINDNQNSDNVLVKPIDEDYPDINSNINDNQNPPLI